MSEDRYTRYGLFKIWLIEDGSESFWYAAPFAGDALKLHETDFACDALEWDGEQLHVSRVAAANELSMMYDADCDIQDLPAGWLRSADDHTEDAEEVPDASRGERWDGTAWVAIAAPVVPKVASYSRPKITATAAEWALYYESQSRATQIFATIF